MNSEDKRPERGTEEYWEWLSRKAKKRGEEIAKAGGADFDECGVISGSVKALNSTDAELFPDELEEYTREERKPKLVPKKKE